MVSWFDPTWSLTPALILPGILLLMFKKQKHFFFLASGSQLLEPKRTRIKNQNKFNQNCKEVLGFIIKPKTLVGIFVNISFIEFVLSRMVCFSHSSQLNISSYVIFFFNWKRKTNLEKLFLCFDILQTTL